MMNFEKMGIGMLLLFTFSCQNKEVNHADGPNFNEIHDELAGHFDQVHIDGNDYYILERDRNNPHEGFGFMALKGNKLFSNQDSIKAMLKTMLELQIQILANQSNKPVSTIDSTARRLLQYNLQLNSK